MPEISPTEALGAQAKKIFFGVARAPKEWSEFQGKRFLALYDKYYFDKQSPEQKKVLRKVRPIIEKRAKALGWVATGVEVAAVASAAVWGFQRLKKGKISMPSGAPIPSDTPVTLTSIASGEATLPHVPKEVIKKPKKETVRKRIPAELDAFTFATDPQALIEKARREYIPPGGGISTNMRMHPERTETVILTPADGSYGPFVEKMRQRQEFEQIMSGVIGVEMPRTLKVSDKEYYVERCRGYTLDKAGKGFKQGPDEGFFAIPMYDRVRGMRTLVRGIGEAHLSGHYISDVNGIALLPDGNIQFLDTSWLTEKGSPREFWQSETGPNSSLKEVFRQFIWRNNPKAAEHIQVPFLNFMIDNAHKFDSAGMFGLAFNTYNMAKLNPFAEGQAVNFSRPNANMQGMQGHENGFDWELLKPIYKAVWIAEHPKIPIYSVPVEERIAHAHAMTLGDLEAKYADMMAKREGLTH